MQNYDEATTFLWGKCPFLGSLIPENDVKKIRNFETS